MKEKSEGSFMKSYESFREAGKKESSQKREKRRVGKKQKSVGKALWKNYESLMSDFARVAGESGRITGESARSKRIGTLKRDKQGGLGAKAPAEFNCQKDLVKAKKSTSAN